MNQFKHRINARMKNIITLLVIGSFISACQKESNENYEISLSGKWSWIESSGGIAYHTITPQTTGKTMTIEFINDSIFKQYQNGVLLYETTYTLKNVQGYEGQLITYKNGIMASIIKKLDGKNLILADYADDGFEDTYRRQ